MDEEPIESVKAEVAPRSQNDLGEMAAVTEAPAAGAASTAAATEESAPPPPISINELEDLSPKQMSDLAHDLRIRLFPARSRHAHVIELVRGALSRGGTVTAEGFVDFSPEYPNGTLRFPKLNFLPVPHEATVSRAMIQQHGLRPGQH